MGESVTSLKGRYNKEPTHDVKDYRIQSRIYPYMDLSLPYMVNFIPFTGIYGTVFSSLLRCALNLLLERK